MSSPQILFRPSRQRSSFTEAPAAPVAAPALQERPRISLDGGLHDQLAGTQAAAARAMRGRTLRVALGFAAVGVAVALWAGPNVEEAAYRVALKAWGSGDDLTTASIAPVGAPDRDVNEAPRELSREPRRGTRRYVVRRSVMQAPGEVCVVGGDGPSVCR